MPNVWFSSDHHFGHHNILQYSNRPWDNVEDMNEGLVERWNEVVKPNDSVYHLGDFCLTSKIELVDEWLGRLNGVIRLVKGNHDKGWLKKIDRLQNRHKIKWVEKLVNRTFVVDNQKYQFVMCHFPLLFWENSHHGSIHIHGHSHGGAEKLNRNIKRMDVGADCHDWYPVHLDEILAHMKNIGTNPHHER